MESKIKSDTFQIAVSDKEQSRLGIGTTSQASERTIYYYAEKTEDGLLYIQALNGNFVPAGEKNPIELEKFVERYKPEPLIYYNKVKPAVDDIQHNLGKAELHLKNNNTEKAEKDYKKVLEVSSKNVKAIFGLGITYLSGGKIEEAGAVFNEIMALDLAFDAEHTHLFNEFGIKMRKAGMLDKSIEYYNKALKLNEGDDHLHFNVARIYCEIEEYERARECLEKSLEINPDFSESIKMLEYIDRLVKNKNNK